MAWCRPKGRPPPSSRGTVAYDVVLGRTAFSTGNEIPSYRMVWQHPRTGGPHQVNVFSYAPKNDRFWHSSTGHLAGASERADTAASPPLRREATKRRASRSARVAPDDKRLISISGFEESSSCSTKRPGAWSRRKRSFPGGAGRLQRRLDVHPACAHRSCDAQLIWGVRHHHLPKKLVSLARTGLHDPSKNRQTGCAHRRRTPPRAR
jgi:hypothetical protein